MKTQALIAAAVVTLFCSTPITAQNSAQSNRAAYDAFKKQAQKEYADFRQKANAEYVEFIRKAWAEFEMQDGQARPQRDTIVPEVVVEDGDSVINVPLNVLTNNDNTASLQSAIEDFFGRIKRGLQGCSKSRKGAPENKAVAVVKVQPEPEPVAPKPVLPEKEKPISIPQDRQSFSFYGTKYDVKRPVDYQYTIGKPKNDNIADAWEWMCKDERFVPMLKDCLALRDSLKLNDWGYLQMLDSIGTSMYGKTNEGRLFTGYLFAQSGYAMRLSRVDNKRIGLMFPSKYKIYDRPFVKYLDVSFYDYNNGRDRNLQVLPEPFNNESDIRLFYDRDQKIGTRPMEARRIVSKRYPEVDVTVTTNKNIVDFYNDYPDGENNDNHMTRYAFHANVPLDSCVKATLYPALAEKIKGMSKLEATERLLNWVQTGFEYEFDDKVWDEDRTFFAEETLFYPYCDCEDRAILFSRLVRDLVGLDVALVYYPGHLATAVNFADESDNVTGSYINLDGRKFVISDPTLIGGRVGDEMSIVDHSKIEAILL